MRKEKSSEDGSTGKGPKGRLKRRKKKSDQSLRADNRETDVGLGLCQWKAKRKSTKDSGW